MSKIAIVLTGCSYGLRNDTRLLKTDWNQSKEQIKSRLIDPFIKQGHEVDVYLTTYVSNEILNLIDFYNPKKTLLLQFANSSQRQTYMQSISQLATENVDLIVTTRFDIAFHTPLTSFNIDFDKFNFFARLSKQRYWEDHRFIDDNLFVFPKKYLSVFVESLVKISQNFHIDVGLHPIYNPIVASIGQDNINFMVDKLTDGTSGDYYNLMRVCFCEKTLKNCNCWTDAFSWQK